MRMSVEDLKKTAKEFQIASAETTLVFNRLEKSVNSLEESWDDASQQIFYNYYEEWHSQIIVISQLLEMAASELDAIAERYLSADEDPVG